MKTIVIDNGTVHASELLRAFSPAESLLSKSLNTPIAQGVFDCIVLSGGSHVPTALRHPDQYQEEITLIQNTTFPIVGICLGCELIVVSFGGTLQELPEKHEGEIELTVTDPTLERFLKRKTVRVHEGHRVAIQALPENFISCAESAHGIEIIRHASKPIIGLQFHPELDQNKDLYAWIYATLGITKQRS